MGCPDFKLEHAPVIEIWKEKSNSNGESTAVLETYYPLKAISVYGQGLSNNMVNWTWNSMSKNLYRKAGVHEVSSLLGFWIGHRFIIEIKCFSFYPSLEISVY